MKLIVNISMLRHPVTGVGRYVLNLLRLVDQHPDVQDLVGITLTGFVQRDQLQRIMRQLDQNEAPQATLKSRVLAWAGQQPLARALQRGWIIALVYLRRNRYRNHVYWETNSGLLPLSGPTLSTVYDLSFLAVPQFHPATRVRELNARIPAYLRKSSRLIAISNYTKAELFKHYTVHTAIDVVPPAVASEYFNVSQQQKEEVRQRLNLPPNYVLAVSTLEPRKNLNRLVQAYSQLPRHLQQAYPLVLAGAQGWLSVELDTSVVRYLGYVAQPDLPAVVAMASLNVYLSLYEGYGMPIAESMAAGSPVLCSNVTSMPEVAANTCFLVDPVDVDAITQSMQNLLESSGLRLSKVEAARHMASTYTWQASANTLISIMQTLST